MVGWFCGAPITFGEILGKSLIPTTIGNLIAAFGFIALPLWIMHEFQVPDSKNSVLRILYSRPFESFWHDDDKLAAAQRSNVEKYDVPIRVSPINRDRELVAVNVNEHESQLSAAVRYHEVEP